MQCTAAPLPSRCTTIVGFSGGHGDHHGCPYRRLDEQALRAALGRLMCDDRWGGGGGRGVKGT